MKKTLKILNLLEKEKIIEQYALGGAFALLFYGEPTLTYDLDVFIFLTPSKKENKIINLAPIYRYLQALGYAAKQEHILIEGVPVQLIPAYNPLVEEAVQNSKDHDYEGVTTHVVPLEYLLAIMIQTNRPKDRERIVQTMESTKTNKKRLQRILKQHLLKTKWEKEIGKI